MPGKTALILSGGGARGAFQCAAEKYAREVKGYHWDLIAGVSVGALNGAMLAMHKFDRLYEVWNTISAGQVYTGGFNLLSVLQVALGAKSFYGNRPLQKLLEQEFDPARLQVELLVGAVSLVTGEYVQFSGRHPDLRQAVLASTVIPIIWAPVDVSTQHAGMVDGGVRNISPIGDVLPAEPDEIVIINCDPEAPQPLPAAPHNLKDIGLRTIDLLLNELFLSDLREFLRINHLVREAAGHGVTLHNPSNGRPLKAYAYKLIQPLTFLGDTLDFSQPTIQHSLQAGLERARQVLG